MKRILFLLATFLISSSFESGVRPPGGFHPDPSEVPDDGRPVILQPGPLDPLAPACRMPFINPFNPIDFFTAEVSVNHNGFSIRLDSPKNIDRVEFRNISNGESYTVWVYRTTNWIEPHLRMSNGLWQIEIVTGGGAHYQTKIMVNNSAFGPLVPCDWIDGDYNPNGNGNMGPF